MSEQTEAETLATDESRIQAAIQVFEPEKQAEEVAEAETQEEPAEVEAVSAEHPGEGEEDDDQPVTPGEENILESSKLASLARRERHAREQSKEREDKLTKREQELDARIKKAEELENQLARIKRDFAYDPVAALKELGIEKGYADAASALYDEELGEDAPAEHRSQREIRALRDRLQRFEEEQKAGEERKKKEMKEAEVANFQKQYIGEMETYMKTVPEELPYAKALFEENAGDAIQAMYSIAYQVAVEDPNAILPTAEQLAEALNTNLEVTLAPVINRILDARTKTPEAETQAEEIPRQKKTLRNSQSRRTTQQSPAQTEEERIKRALQALG
tara:strand:+ start:1304 stop:2305 length:1002 start_codon:yes stop_codon:yes gene_type:complete